MDPSLPADPATIAPPPTIEQMTAQARNSAGTEAGGRRGRRRPQNRPQITPQVPSSVRFSSHSQSASHNVSMLPEDTIASVPSEYPVQQEATMPLDSVIASMTQESIQHNICLEDSREQIDPASDTLYMLSASIVTSEAPPFPDPQASLVTREMQNQYAIATFTKASNEKASQDVTTEGETDDLYASDPLYNQEICMETVKPHGNAIPDAGQHMSWMPSEPYLENFSIEQQGSSDHYVQQTTSVLAGSLHVADIKKLPEIKAGAERQANRRISDDMVPRSQLPADAQVPASSSTLDPHADAHMFTPPFNKPMLSSANSKSGLGNISSHRLRPAVVGCTQNTLKEQSETDNASEITNPYVKGPNFSSHELVKGAFTTLNALEGQDYWAENSALQPDGDSSLKGSTRDLSKELQESRERVFTSETQPTEARLGPPYNCNDDARAEYPVESELSEAERTGSTMAPDSSKNDSISGKNKSTFQHIKVDVPIQSSSAPKPAPSVDAQANSGGVKSVIFLSERRAKSCKHMSAEGMKLVHKATTYHSGQPEPNVIDGITEASNIAEQIKSMSDPMSSIDIPSNPPPPSAIKDPGKVIEILTGHSKDIFRPVRYSSSFIDNSSLFPLLPSASAAKVLGFLDTVLADELAAASAVHAKVPSYKQLILQAIRFRLLSVCPELRNCTFDTDEHRTNLARFCRDLLFNLPDVHTTPPAPSAARAGVDFKEIQKLLISSSNADATVYKCLEKGAYDHALYLAIISGNPDVLVMALSTFEGHVYGSIDPALALLYSSRNRWLQNSFPVPASLQSTHNQTPSTYHSRNISLFPNVIGDVPERPQMLTVIEQDELYTNGEDVPERKNLLVSLLRNSGPDSSIRKQYAAFTATDILHKIAFTYMYVPTKEERNDSLVALLMYAREVSENQHIRALLCILLGIPPIYDKYGRFCFTNLCSGANQAAIAESQHSQLGIGGGSSVGLKHAKSDATSELDLFLQKLAVKSIQTVDLFTFRMHEILEYIHFRANNVPHELFYQSIKPVLLSHYGFYQSYRYDITLPFFPHILPYKLAFSGFLRRNSQTNDTIARHGLLYSTVAYNSIEQIISRVNLAEEYTIRKGAAIVECNPLLMKPSCLPIDVEATPTNDTPVTAPSYPLAFDYCSIVAPMERGETFVGALRLASNYKKELRSKASISAKYVKELMLTSSEAVDALHQLQKEAQSWTSDIMSKDTLQKREYIMLQDIQSYIKEIDIDCAFTADFASVSMTHTFDDDGPCTIYPVPVPALITSKSVKFADSAAPGKRRRGTAAQGRNSNDGQDYSDNVTTMTAHLVEPSLTERDKNPIDYLLQREPEFLFQHFLQYKDIRDKAQISFLFQDDKVDTHSDTTNNTESDDSSLDFGLHSEFDDSNSNNDDAKSSDRGLMETSSTAVITDQSTGKYEERIPKMHQSSSTPVPAPLYNEDPTSFGILSLAQGYKARPESIIRNVIDKEQQVTNRINDADLPVDRLPSFTSLKAAYSTATTLSRMVPPGFTGNSPVMAILDKDEMTSDYESSSSQDIIPSRRTPAIVVHADPLNALGNKGPTQAAQIPVAPPHMLITPPVVSVIDNIPGTGIVPPSTGAAPDSFAPMIMAPSSYMGEVSEHNMNEATDKPVNKVPEQETKEEKPRQQAKEKEKSKPQPSRLMRLFPGSKQTTGDGAVVVDLKANSTGKMVFSTKYNCWVKLDEDGNEIPPPAQEIVAPPPVVTESSNSAPMQFQTEARKKPLSSRAGNRTVSSRYKLVKE